MINKISLPNLYVILAGLLCGAVFTFLPGAFFVIILFLASIFFIKYNCRESEDFLIKIFLIGFLIRILLCFCDYFFGILGSYGGPDTQPDALIYNGNAFYIANIIKGSHPFYFIKEPFVNSSLQVAYQMYGGNLPPFGIYQYGFYVHLLGVIYAWLGYAPLAIKFLNSLLGCLSAFLVYKISKVLIKSELVAKISFVAAIFFPSLIYWSVTMLQDALVNFLFLAYIYTLLIGIMENKKTFFVISLAVAVLFSFLKTKLAAMVIASLLLVLFLTFLKRLFKIRILTRIFLLFCLIILTITLIHSFGVKVLDILKENIVLIFNYHKVSATDYGSASSYRLYKDFIYNFDVLDIKYFMDISIIFSIFKGVTFYFLSPFVWEMPYEHPMLLIFYPQTIFMFLTLPFLFLGILNLLLKNTLPTLIVVMMVIIFSIPQALAEAIIGNVVRHRDMFTPILIIFISYGFSMVFLPKEKNLTK